MIGNKKTSAYENHLLIIQSTYHCWAFLPAGGVCALQGDTIDRLQKQNPLSLVCCRWGLSVSWFPCRLLKTINLSPDPQQQAHIRAFEAQRGTVWNCSWVSARGFPNMCRAGWPWHSFGQVRQVFELRICTSEVQEDCQLCGSLASCPGLIWEIYSSSEVDPEAVLTSPPAGLCMSWGCSSVENKHCE